MNIIAIRSLKIPLDSILEGVIFKNFLGGMPPDPPRVCMLRMHMSFAHYVSASSMHINNDDKSGCGRTCQKLLPPPLIRIAELS